MNTETDLVARKARVKNKLLGLFSEARIDEFLENEQEPERLLGEALLVRVIATLKGAPTEVEKARQERKAAYLALAGAPPLLGLFAEQSPIEPHRFQDYMRPSAACEVCGRLAGDLVHVVPVDVPPQPEWCTGEAVPGVHLTRS